jgi:hypothetical protein
VLIERVLQALPKWHYISLDPSRRTAAWPPGGAAAVSRPRWFNSTTHVTPAALEDSRKVTLHRRLG